MNIIYYISIKYYIITRLHNIFNFNQMKALSVCLLLSNTAAFPLVATTTSTAVHYPMPYAPVVYQ